MSGSKATEEDLIKAWYEDLPLKKYAASIGMSPNTLRDRWTSLFGREAFLLRCKRLKPPIPEWSRLIKRKPTLVNIACTICKSVTQISLLRKVKLTRDFVCDICLGDRDCPVCAQRVLGVQGLACHFGHQQHEIRHAQYLVDQENLKWEGAEEGLDYLVCQVCGFRGKSLIAHVPKHNLTIKEYQIMYGGANRAEKSNQKISKGLRATHLIGANTSGTKPVTCPCGFIWEAPKQLAVTAHDIRCISCRAIDEIVDPLLLWVGKTEPEDYVTCRVCNNYRAESLVSHLMNEHPDSLSDYKIVYGISPVAQSKEVRRIISIDKAVLKSYSCKNGKINIAKAMRGTKHSFSIIARECHYHKLPISRQHVKETLCLQALSDILGMSYKQEWTHPNILSSRTGYRFRYDGYFEALNLLVEFHGVQHTQYPNHLMRKEEDRPRWEAQQWRDAEKVRLAAEYGYSLLIVREDEPYQDTEYLRKRLQDILP